MEHTYRVGNRYYCGNQSVGGGNRYCVKDLDTNAYIHSDYFEKGQSRDYWPSHNLLPFLKEGQNTIQVFTAVGGWGEVFLNFRVQQACEPNCIDTWENNCTEYEGRVKP